ncbi:MULTISPECIES: thioesterase II family protein [unclassified Bradyrhizobium]|uniref:thioesterase II family protein n=1 Tax=unclassified Bradyrhizobium TaxID=2631580 RepID=UPI0028E20428|nr:MULTISPECIES: alpha/beta fold hydrolase [unclassified Bradyrhizobium]
MFNAAPLGRTPSMPIRLFCFAHAGGTGKLFRSWQKLLQPGIDVCTFEYSGHGTRINEPLLDTIEQIADSAVEEISCSKDGPYALIGHSMGSLVAFETCHALAKHGLKMPTLLIVCGHRAPRVPPVTPPLHNAPDREFLAHLHGLGATPPEIFDVPDLLDLMLPILRADFRACETYRPAHRPYLSVPIAAYGGLTDSDTSKDSLLAWQAETTSRCMVRMFPGGHFFVSDCADSVVAHLKRDLLQASTVVQV